MMQNKFFTLSYDDGITQDKRLVKIFNKYGIRATFNINSELLGNPGYLDARICGSVTIKLSRVKWQSCTGDMR